MELILYAILIFLALAGLSYFGVKKFMESSRARADHQRSLSMTFLKIRVPKRESKQEKEDDSQSGGGNRDFKDPMAVMKQFYESLAGLVDGTWQRHLKGQELLSFEYVVQNNQIELYVVVPSSIRVLIEKQVTAFFPDSFLEEESSYYLFEENAHVSACYIGLAKESIYPLRTYQRMTTDPFNTITNVLSKLEPHEGAVIQMVIRPEPNGWQEAGRARAKEILEDKPKKKGFFKSIVSNINPLQWVQSFFSSLLGIQGGDDKPDLGGSRTTPMLDEQVKAMEEKNTQVGFDTVIRLLASSDNEMKATALLSSMKSAFAQYATTDNNSLTIVDKRMGNPVHAFLARSMERPKKMSSMILSPEELASIFHLPNIRFNKAPNLHWQNYKIAPAPANIPQEGILLGHNIYRGVKKEIHMKNEDRFRHFYVIGQTGTGKSSILQVMIRQDFRAGRGVCIVDPHGQLIEDVLPFIPRERADDVIYFNPADMERPMGLNLLEADTPEDRDLIALEAMNIMIKLFNEETFGPRIQDYFRNGCLTLMESEEGGALTDIVRLFTDDEFQKTRTRDIQNPIVRSFWEHQMAKTGAREKQEMIPYFASKFGQFVTNGMMRNVIGQTKSAFQFADVMNNNKILLINLSKGETGDINSKLLGMIVVTKLQAAALARQRMPKEQRKDFFLYIDEFQNYVTDSIEVILSEARKYRLSLNMAHQYLGQLEPRAAGKGGSGPNLKDAIFGNVGTILSYKIGAQDAEYMAKEMAPVFSDQDLVNIDKFKAVMKLSIDTQPSKPFSIIPVNPYLEEGDHEVAEALKQLSRLKYGRDREFVEREVFRRLGAVF